MLMPLIQAASTSNAAGLSGSAASVGVSSSASSTAVATSQEVKLSLTIRESIFVSLTIDSAEQHAQEMRSLQMQVSDLQNQLADIQGKLAASDKACAATQQELHGVHSKLAMSNKACKVTEEKLAVSEAASKQKDQMIGDPQSQLKAAAETFSKVPLFLDEQAFACASCVDQACMFDSLTLTCSQTSRLHVSCAACWAQQCVGRQTSMHS